MTEQDFEMFDTFFKKSEQEVPLVDKCACTDGVYIDPETGVETCIGCGLITGSAIAQTEGGQTMYMRSVSAYNPANRFEAFVETFLSQETVIPNSIISDCLILKGCGKIGADKLLSKKYPLFGHRHFEFFARINDIQPVVVQPPVVAKILREFEDFRAFLKMNLAKKSSPNLTFCLARLLVYNDVQFDPSLMKLPLSSLKIYDKMFTRWKQQLI